MKNVGRGIVKLIIILAFIAGVVYIGRLSMPNINLGLDLAGGVSITYEAGVDNPTPEEMGDSVYKLQLKAQDYSTEAEVYQEGNNRINIDIPGVSDANEILEELGKPGTLYFVEEDELSWPLLATNSEIATMSELATSSEILTDDSEASSSIIEESDDEAVEGHTNTAGGDSEIKSDESDDSSSDTSSDNTENNPLGDNVHIEGANVYQNPDGTIQIGGTPEEGAVLTQQGDANGAISINGNIGTNSIIATNSDLATASDVDIIYPNYDYSQPPIFEKDINVNERLIDGNMITSARAGMAQDNYGQTQYVIDLVFNDEGKDRFAKATEQSLGRPIYIIYNDVIQSFPTVQSVITDGRAQITGMSDLESAERLASTIRIGALKLPLNILRSNVVGAKLGQDAITTSLRAGLIGFGIICLFMIVVYLLPGLAASLALTIYVGLTLFLIQGFNITLTLPGIAGIILSIGMAVDANVIIFTRIREEIGTGKSTRVAIKDGYNKALSAILDGNITTLIAAFVLNVKGTGSIKGFAATLALGIVLSMFTALFVTRFIMNTFLDLGFDNEKLYGKKVDKKIINFVGFRKVSYVISVLLIVVGIAFVGINAGRGNKGFNYGVDFNGGSSMTINFNENLSLDEIESKVVPIFEEVSGSADIQTQKVVNSNEVIVKTIELDEETQIEEIRQKLIAEFNIESDSITTSNISGSVSAGMRQDAIIAVVIATILMLIYIWFRFKDIRFAGSAVLALIHDCLVTIGFYAVFRWTVDSTFIACMLTIVGYSINATIVIFDRIRENLGRLRGESVDVIVNTSITQTFTRSVNTSLTTLITVVVLYILGVSSIKAFALPLIIGIVCGCYSSVCITGPLWFDFKNAGNKSVVTAKPEIGKGDTAEGKVKVEVPVENTAKKKKKKKR